MGVVEVRVSHVAARLGHQSGGQAVDFQCLARLETRTECLQLHQPLAQHAGAIDLAFRDIGDADVRPGKLAHAARAHPGAAGAFHVGVEQDQHVVAQRRAAFDQVVFAPLGGAEQAQHLRIQDRGGADVEQGGEHAQGVAQVVQRAGVLELAAQHQHLGCVAGVGKSFRAVPAQRGAELAEQRIAVPLAQHRILETFELHTCRQAGVAVARGRDGKFRRELAEDVEVHQRAFVPRMPVGP